MNIKRPWAFWRRVQYGSGFLVTLLLLVGGTWAVLHDEVVSCFDGIQNGSERGIDCGGTCVRICSAEAIPPNVLWAESFEIAPGQYNATAYVENRNPVASVERLTYTFELLNGGQVVATRNGETVLPPGSIYPIFEGRIATNGQTVTETQLRIDPIEIWQPATLGREQFAVSDISLTGADARPRLDASIENRDLINADAVQVVATIFNDAGQPLTSSATFIESIPGRSRVPVVFTWPNSIAKTIRSCAIPSDVVVALDVSGSMNNDSDNPPQPITDATAAAARFVERLGPSDQVAVVTFATEALLFETFTSEKNTVAAAINTIAITPEDERGFTNTVAALETIQTVFTSPERNPDARRAAIILTDGLPTSATATTEELTVTATALARAIDTSGATIYAIGLGENLDRAFIASLASSPSQVYFAPSGAELDRIYNEITTALCESGAARIDVIAKTRANFTPLR